MQIMNQNMSSHIIPQFKQTLSEFITSLSSENQGLIQHSITTMHHWNLFPSFFSQIIKKIIDLCDLLLIENYRNLAKAIKQPKLTTIVGRITKW